MNTQPPHVHSLVSVIISVYNAEDFIGDAIASVFAQNYPYIEIIAVNDGSTDNSLVVLQRHMMDSGIIINQTNTGVAAARNNGITRAKGEYLAFLDCDDIFLPNKISSQVKYLQAHSEAQICVPLCEGFLDEGLEKPAWVRDGFLHAFHRNLSPSAWMVRRSLFSEIGLFDQSFVSTNDIDFLVRIEKAGYSIGTVEQLLWKKRVHNRNVSAYSDSKKIAQYHRELLTLVAKKLI